MTRTTNHRLEQAISRLQKSSAHPKAPKEYAEDLIVVLTALAEVQTTDQERDQLSAKLAAAREKIAALREVILGLIACKELQHEIHSRQFGGTRWHELSTEYLNREPVVMSAASVILKATDG